MNPRTGLPNSLCNTCGTPLRDCPYMLNSKMNEPAFMPGQEHVEREILNWGREPFMLYITTKCPLYVKDESEKPICEKKLQEQAVRRQKLIKLWFSGLTQIKIGEILDCSLKTINRDIKAMGLKKGGNK